MRFSFSMILIKSFKPLKTKVIFEQMLRKFKHFMIDIVTANIYNDYVKYAE